MPWYERGRFDITVVEQIRTIAARDLENVPETLRGKQTDLDTFTLGDSVNDNSSAVRKKCIDSGATAAARSASITPFSKSGGVVSTLAVFKVLKRCESRSYS